MLQNFVTKYDKLGYYGEDIHVDSIGEEKVPQKEDF